VITTLSRSVPPCFLAAITTAAGFSSLAVIAVVPLKEFGMMAAAGVMFSFVISILLVPALLRIRPGAIPPSVEKSSAGWVKLLQVLNRNGLWVVAVALLITAVSISGILKVRIETSPYGFFPDDHPLNRARRSIQKAYGVASTIDLSIRRRDGGLIDGPALRELETLRVGLLRHELFKDSLSVLDIGELLTGDEQKFIESMGDKINPAVRPNLIVVMRGNDLFKRYLSADGVSARMTLMLSDHTAERVMRALDLLESESSKAAPNLEIVPTGQTVLFTKMIDLLFSGQVASVALILIFVTIVFILAYRSPLAGLISLVPNVTPIVLTLGMMGWLGIPLNVLTIMVSSIAIGIAVDDTIHFMHQLRFNLASGAEYDDAIDAAIAAKARPILITSLLLASAFLTHVVSDFLPTIYLGLLTAMTMISALVGDLVLLPALLRLVRPRLRFSEADRGEDREAALGSQ